MTRPALHLSARATAAAFLASAVSMATAMGGGVSSAGPTSVLIPGESAVRLSSAPGGLEYGCTVWGGDSAVAVTAGHCASSVSLPAYFDLSLAPAGRSVAWSPMESLDYSVIRLSPGTLVVSRVVAAPPAVGAMVCKRGRMTGRTCGPVTFVSGTRVGVRLRSAPGDSGGVAVDGAGRTVGLLSRATDLPPSAAAAAAQMAGSALGVLPPGTTEFVRADAIVRDLSARWGIALQGTGIR